MDDVSVLLMIHKKIKRNIENSCNKHMKGLGNLRGLKTAKEALVASDTWYVLPEVTRASWMGAGMTLGGTGTTGSRRGGAHGVVVWVDVVVEWAHGVVGWADVVVGWAGVVVEWAHGVVGWVHGVVELAGVVVEWVHEVVAWADEVE
ncbi:hypothetical protein E2C01_032164 [Portunus trituberculatus]|uniref:Uncharacterized protein n=1 Tax=Portunus trituberculatus TaxID=210409 RepID=A0A5B7F231_PORTR|nr:hypothetical protein [Portunus trituberculatus]